MFKFVCFMVLVGFLSFSVLGTAPPVIPVESYGEVVVDGGVATDGVEVSTDYGDSVVVGGYYSLFLEGDNPLTYASDADCSQHWADSEACVPCDDCIEGPVDGDIVKISVGGRGAMPFLVWEKGSIGVLDLIVPIGDWDRAGDVGIGDLGFLVNHYGEDNSGAGWDDLYDLYVDGQIDMADLGVYLNHYGEGS